ncbi:P-loop containing nucleoside triphosphate hydrolase protein [Hysterangium stoloniferum]|nr:P-loop containing nucleoside triphosphate hydrolase protein [Hysterangium stoloniferum]
MQQTTVTISDTSFAKRRGDLMKLISSLRSLGAQAELDLPRIVCIGSQSAGKSSLIEAISQIHVPRDSGTCTRYAAFPPLTKPDGKWSATITLRIEFDDAGKRLPAPETCVFGQDICDTSAVEPALRRAQAAVLNWGIRPCHDFLSMDDAELRAQSGLKFSKNVVCITISGPKLTDLATTLTFRTGLIQNAEEDMINLVESTVTEQIKGNSIILVTIPMSDDLENQKAALLAKREDAAGSRTIGVLTKPDMLTAGASRSKQAWLDIIEGRKQVLKHGYYCTRQPEDSDRINNITFDQARQNEANFFQNTSPWSTSLHTDRFGTLKLTEKLSNLLSEKINESLPQLQAEVRKALDETNSQLARLPPALSGDPSSNLMALVTQFCATFDGYAEGRRNCERLVQENLKTYRTFKLAIRCSAPDFRPFECKDDDNEDTDISRQITEIVGDEPLPEKTESLSSPSPVYLEEVRDHLLRAKTRELPYNTPFPAKVSLIEEFTKTWEAPVEDCFEDVKNRIDDFLKDLIKKDFGRFFDLETQVRELVNAQVDICTNNTKAILSTILECELSPFTQNSHYYQTCRGKFLAHFRAVRAEYLERKSSQEERADSEHGNTLGSRITPLLQREALAALAKLGHHVQASDLQKLIPSDPWEEEMTVAAEVRSYYQTSYKRIIDNVPMIIDNTFFRRLSRGLLNALILGLGFSDPKTAASYLCEDKNVVEKREELLSRKKRLDNVRRELSRFGY